MLENFYYDYMLCVYDVGYIWFGAFVGTPSYLSYIKLLIATKLYAFLVKASILVNNLFLC